MNGKLIEIENDNTNPLMHNTFLTITTVSVLVQLEASFARTREAADRVCAVVFAVVQIFTALIDIC